MVLILGLIALLQTSIIGLFALHNLNQSLDEQIGKQALHVAKTIAAMSEVIDAVQRKDSAMLQPLSMHLAQKAQTRFVVFGDNDSNRLSHPNPAMIGLSLVDDDDDDISLR
ncbi:hypothetical protein [Aliamphritea spongicola]|nr:hypothetical protein [Aliamphritea spongicola]